MVCLFKLWEICVWNGVDKLPQFMIEVRPTASLLSLTIDLYWQTVILTRTHAKNHGQGLCGYDVDRVSVRSYRVVVNGWTLS